MLFRSFKTGAPTPHHLDQLRTYEILWEYRDHNEDSDLHVTHLSVAYADHEITVDALPAEALAPAADELLARVGTAAESITMRPPEALGETSALTINFSSASSSAPSTGDVMRTVGAASTVVKTQRRIAKAAAGPCLLGKRFVMVIKS